MLDKFSHRHLKRLIYKWQQNRFSIQNIKQFEYSVNNIFTYPSTWIQRNPSCLWIQFHKHMYNNKKHSV